jgi:hypothetical protein
MGEMQPAAEDAYRHRDQYDVAAWAVTEDEITLISSYVNHVRRPSENRDDQTA